MPHRCLSILMSVLMLLLCVAPLHAAKRTPPKPQPAIDPFRKTMELAIGKVKPALVRIHVVATDFSGGREVRHEAYGSGAIISSQGYVITNHHVAGDATEISCTLATKEEVEAKLIATDALTDIAVIQLTPKTPRSFPYAVFGDSSKLQVGDRIFAMGSPLAFSQSITMGVVSNTELIFPETFGDEALTLDGEDVGSIVRWIGHDAEIFPGNSGGPLVNQFGEIVGINEISIGLSGAIPGNLANSVASQLIKQGKVTRAWLGFDVQPLLKSSTVKHGILITDIAPQSPAERAGLKPGDLLIRMNGRPVDVRFKEEVPLFNQSVMSLPIGRQIPAIVVRQGREQKVTLIPVERPDPRQKKREIKVWGISAQNRPKNAKADAAGIRVTGIRTGSPADSAKPALEPGDIITNIGEHEVSDLASFEQHTGTLLADAADQLPVLVTFTRGDESYLTVVKLGPQSVKEPSREVRKPWVPFSTQVITKEIATALGLNGKVGVRITQLYPNTAAVDAGLQVGDIITAVDGMPVEASQVEDTEVLPTMIRQYKIGSEVQLSLIRDKQPQQVTLKLTQAPKQPRDMKNYREDNYDFVARDLAYIDRVSQNLADNESGVLIVTVGEGGWAALGRLRAGDLLYMLDGKPIASVEDLDKLMQDIKTSRPEVAVMQVKRDGKIIYLELQNNWMKNGQ